MSVHANRLSTPRRLMPLGVAVIAAMALLLGLGRAPSQAQSTCGGTTLIYGRAVLGQIGGAGVACRYTFTGKTGEVITVRLARRNSTTLDPFLTVQAPNRTSKTDDNNGGVKDSAVAGYTLPANGTYSITASGASRTTGSFVAALAKCAALPSSGRSTSASLTNGQIACYRFTARLGQAIDIRMDEGKADSTFDPALDLYTPDGKLRKAVTARGGTSAQLTDTLPTSGVYTLVARSNRDQGAGSYTLRRYK